MKLHWFLLASFGVAAGCESDPARPPVIGDDVPTVDVPDDRTAPPQDVQDASLEDRADVTPTDRPALDVPVTPDVPVVPDVTGPDAPVMDTPPVMDVTLDRAASDAADVPLPPVDIPAGRIAFCDLPETAASRVTAAIPAGFCIRRYATVGHPRVMAFAPNGDLFVSSPLTTGPGGTGPGRGEIVVLPDDNRDGVADSIVTYQARTSMRELDTVHGLLFHNSSLYYTTFHGVHRYPHATGSRAAPAGPPELIADLSESERWTHTLAVKPDGRMFVSMGIYGSSICPYPTPERGAILEIGPGHSMLSGRTVAGSIVARGFRNPMYIRCQPSGDCFAAELTDDGWTAPGREKILRFNNNEDYGYPCCYERGLPSPYNPGGMRYSCANVTASLAGFPVGHTPFGHDFERNVWSDPTYRASVYVGLHGVVGSWDHTGINRLAVDPMTRLPTGTPQPFMTWGPGTPNVGRVADLVFAPDGRMFFTDDQLGMVFWIAPRDLLMPVR